MNFPNIVEDRGRAFLKHDSVNNKTFIYFIQKRLKRRNIDEKTINRIVDQYKLVFCNHSVETSHFVNTINNDVFAKYYKDDFFKYLFIYIKQVYPNEEIFKDINDASSLSAFFDNKYKEFKDIWGNFVDEFDPNVLQNYMASINDIERLFIIIEEFMIRFYGYSIVGISKQPYIITSCNDCHKRFYKYLWRKHALLRFQSIRLVNEQTDKYGLDLIYIILNR